VFLKSSEAQDSEAVVERGAGFTGVDGVLDRELSEMQRGGKKKEKNPKGTLSTA